MYLDKELKLLYRWLYQVYQINKRQIIKHQIKQ